MFRAILCILVFAAASCFIPAFPQSGEQRLALVIDQTEYRGDLTRIALADAEADQIESALRSTGFSITRRSNLNKSQLRDVLDDFRVRLDRAGSNAVGFVYYTGHGAQHPETRDSYLLGTDARLRAASDLAVYGLDMKTQRDGFAATGAKAVFLVFDACRNLPSGAGFKTGAKGLNRVEARADMLIAFATSLDDVAAEGVYAPILAEEIARAGQTAEAAFAAAQRRVANRTGRRQLPWTNNLLYNEVCFAGCDAAPVSATSTPATRPATRPVTSTPSYEPGQIFRDALSGGGQGPQMVVVPAGSFTMGSPPNETDRDDDEGPQTRITIAAPFAVGEYEVTVAQFDAFVRETGYDAGDRCMTYEGGSWEWRDGKSWRNPGFAQTTDHPVACVDWNAAKAYANWLSRKTGESYRLLTEAEWEYAARAGTSGRFSNDGGEPDLCGIANGADAQTSWSWKNTACSDGFANTSPSGAFDANAFGLHDMHGNVWEWVEDCWTDDLTSQAANGAVKTTSNCPNRVIRGGSWSNRPRYLRSADRGWDSTGSRSSALGFRLARTL